MIKHSQLKKEDFKKVKETKMTKERLLPKGKMITNSKAVSYYQKGNKYYSNSGWLEREISYEIFEKEVIEDKGDLE